MTDWWIYALIGAALGAPFWIAAAVWATRRVWLNARRLSARAKGQERLIELGQLVGGLAHEIKNPLSTVNVNLKLLLEDLSRSEDQNARRLTHRLRAVQIEADRIKDILDDFLRFAGRYELSLAWTDLRRLIGELLDFFAPQAEAGHVVLRPFLPDQPVRCRVDAGLIKQAMLNLMINAVQAMTAGGELIIRLSPQRTDAVIDVIDTGPGISKEDIERVFEVYFSTKPHGSGLGLPTTRRIIREHGGSIRVESEIGKGTRFIIALPLERG